MQLFDFQKAAFYLPKDGLLRAKSLPFTRQKTAFYNTSDYQQVTKGVSLILQRVSRLVGIGLFLSIFLMLKQHSDVS